VAEGGRCAGRDWRPLSKPRASIFLRAFQVTVHGILRDKAGEPVFRFETQREFEPRLFEYGDEQILENNVKDLAKDVADYLDRIVTGKPLKD
jgi:hypothetical protein